MGFDEAILANERGEIVEASAFNVFWTVGDRAFTPAPECGPLPGVFAAYFTRLAAEAGVEVRSVRADVADLALADAIVLTNSLGEAMTAASLDDRPLQRPPDRSAIGLVLNEIDARRSERADARLHPASADFALRPESPSAATDSSAPRR
jgi:branched-subunit amino acid aminotransferase/4-amino-4-deoxychorismate lyase